MTDRKKPKRCVLTMHQVASIKDLVFVVGGNSESSAQKAIFEILADGVREANSRSSRSSAREKCVWMTPEEEEKRIAQAARKDEREKVQNLTKKIIETLASTEGFVPTAIRSEVMRLRERLQESLRGGAP